MRVEHVEAHLKLPSTPETSIALIIILVSLNGTCIQNDIETQLNTHSTPLQQLWAHATSMDATHGAGASPRCNEVSHIRETLCLLRKLLSVHGGLKAVAKIDVQQLATVSVQHEVAWMPVPQPQQVAHLHMNNRKISAPGCAAKVEAGQRMKGTRHARRNQHGYGRHEAGGSRQTMDMTAQERV